MLPPLVAGLSIKEGIVPALGRRTIEGNGELVGILLLLEFKSFAELLVVVVAVE